MSRPFCNAHDKICAQFISHADDLNAQYRLNTEFIQSTHICHTQHINIILFLRNSIRLFFACACFRCTVYTRREFRIILVRRTWRLGVNIQMKRSPMHSKQRGGFRGMPSNAQQMLRSPCINGRYFLHLKKYVFFTN